MNTQNNTSPNNSSELYGESYYESHLGPHPYVRSERWLNFFGQIADKLIQNFSPSKVFDAGCALGFLVESFWDRGVEAYGRDISTYAISQVRPDIRSYCSQGSIAEPIEGKYDLVTCIEVLEHMPEDEAIKAIQMMATVTDKIVFSSSATDFSEITHINVRPSIYWLKQFAKVGFSPLSTFEASFIAPHAFVLKRDEHGHSDHDLLVFSKIIQLRVELAQIDARLNAEFEAHLGAAQIEMANRSLIEKNDILEKSQSLQEAIVTRFDRQLYEIQRDNELEREAYTSQLERFHNIIQMIEQQNKGLEWELSHLNSSRGVRVIKLARASRAVLKYKGPFALARHTIQWLFGKRGYHLQDLISPPIIQPQIMSKDEYRSVIFISGCPGDSRRYRCYHQAEQLGLIGTTFEVSDESEVDYSLILDQYQHFVLHRVAYSALIQWFIDEAHVRNKIVIFDTDDLVFEPEAAKYVAALKDMTRSERELYLEGLDRYQKTMRLCDAITVSTTTLKEHAERLSEKVFIIPNAVSKEMVNMADSAIKLASHISRPSRIIVIGYFSGTATHNRDFLEAADAVLWALANYPEVQFKLVGPLRLDPRFEQYQSRIDHLPLQKWQDLPQLYMSVDISLAPLEPDNPFVDSKSCIKYLEAALLGIPTIASSRPDFVRVIENGKNAFLADTKEEWQIAMKKLIESSSLRKQVGQAAFDDVRNKSTTLAQALFFNDTLYEVIDECQNLKEKRRLSINWILLAPIAERGGGYRTIFRLANFLSEQGHLVRIYIDPIAHLERLSVKQIQDFVEKNFGTHNLEIIVGHDKILPADATIATNWPTAYVVDKHRESLHKFYFIQDFEPEFYEPSNKAYNEAELTYYLPMQHISIGGYLSNRVSVIAKKPSEVINFAIDQSTFYQKTPPTQRGTKPKILFFARPGLKRRGYTLGIEALKQVKEKHPEVDIMLFGSTNEEIGKLPFPAKILGILTPEQLMEVFNSVHILLTFSLSNISWVPFEGMACGVAVVEANVPSVRQMITEGTCLLADLDPNSVAIAISQLIDEPQLREAIATRAVQEIQQFTWQHSLQQFEQILLRHCW